MNIDWHALFTVFAVTLAATVGLVGVFTLGITGMSPRRGSGSAAAVAGRAGAYLCFAACAAAVGWGITLIVTK